MVENGRLKDGQELILRACGHAVWQRGIKVTEVVNQLTLINIRRLSWIIQVGSLQLQGWYYWLNCVPSRTHVLKFYPPDPSPLEYDHIWK